jgi:hypothetical protein
MALVTIPVLARARDFTLSRNLHCERYELARSQEICGALEREMEWTWTGHAVIWPGYRVTWPSLRRVFCTLHIDSGDTPALVQLVVWHRKGEWNDDRLEFGATSLLKLLGKKALQALPAPESIPNEMGKTRLRSLRGDIEQILSDNTFVYNPSNPEYILRDGCPKE